MEEFELDIENRTKLGTSASRKAKRKGMVPGVLYQGNEGVPISLKEDEIRPIVDKNGSDILINVNFNGRKIKTKIQEIQREPINDEILHVDLIPLDSIKRNTSQLQ